MKRLLPLMLLLSCLAACDPAAPRSQAAAALLPETPQVTELRTAANGIISPEAEEALYALLTEAAVQPEARTAGASLRLSALAGKLLDWQSAADPSPAATETAARSFAADMDPTALLALSERLETLQAVALALCAGKTGALEDSGYLPRCQPWEASAADAFFDALIRGMKSEYSDNESGKNEYFSAISIAGGRKVCYDTGDLKIFAHPVF